jgi:hypothetical protein
LGDVILKDLPKNFINKATHIYNLLEMASRMHASKYEKHEKNVGGKWKVVRIQI